MYLWRSPYDKIVGKASGLKKKLAGAFSKRKRFALEYLM